MGMYTQLMMGARIKNDPEAVGVLKYMCDCGDKPPTLPDHPLFSTHRWERMLRSSSHYFVPHSVTEFEYNDIGEHWHLVSLSNLKNYDDEIGKFIDWITPYLEPEGEMIGYSRYEEDREPTIYYAPDLD